ncbi:hypothetical protein WOLCODRAFT_128032, partial [Wolfiporia cocos MD-104 SS10]
MVIDMIQTRILVSLKTHGYQCKGVFLSLKTRTGCAMSSAIHSLVATRYLAVVGATVSLWDHCLTIDREASLAWRRPWTSLQALVMSNLYMARGSIMCLAFMTADNSKALITTTRCRAILVYLSIMGTMSAATMQFALLLRVYTLWDSRKIIKTALVFGFVICYSVTVYSIAEVIRLLVGRIYYSSHIGSCVLTSSTTYITGVWGGIVAYDLFVGIMLIGNVLSTPRRHNSEIITRLGRDGAAVFLVISAFHLLNLLVTTIGGGSNLFLVTLVTWSIETSIGFRLFLRVQAMSVKKTPE